MKIGDEVIITGISRFSNGYPIGTIGYIIDIREYLHFTGLIYYRELYTYLT